MARKITQSLSDLEKEKREAYKIKDYKLAKEIQNKLDYYYYGVQQGWNMKYFKIKYKGQSELMTKNARKSNSKRNPDGYIYIVKLRGFDIYKIGVSGNVKRRVFDIDSHSPFGVDLLDSFYFKDVYNIEEMIHDNLEKHKFRKEWFKMESEHLSIITEQIKYLSDNGYYLTRR